MTRKIDSRIIDIWGEKYIAKEHLGGERCTVCGKLTSPKSKGLGVIVSDGGSSIIHPDDNEKEIKEYPAGYMGWWAVGTECIKKVPVEYRTGLSKQTETLLRQGLVVNATTDEVRLRRVNNV